MLYFINQPTAKYLGQWYLQKKVYGRQEALEALLKVPNAIVVESYRTREEQQKHIANGTSWTMDSNHRRGVAFDVVNFSEVRDEMLAAGFTHPGTQEGWGKDYFHFVYGGSEEKARMKYPILLTPRGQAQKLNQTKLQAILTKEYMGKKYPKGSEEYLIRTQEVAFMLVALPGMVDYIRAKGWTIHEFTKEFVWYAENKTNTESYQHWENVIAEYNKAHPPVTGSVEELGRYVVTATEEIQNQVQSFIDKK